MNISRRNLVGGAALGALAVTGSQAVAAPIAPSPRDLPVLTDNGQLALPRGFKAKRVSTIDVEPVLDDRNGNVVGRTPSNLDGTGLVEYRNTLRLIRNHECRANAWVPVPLVAGTVYDAGCPTGMGGNTVVETDRQGNFKQQWVALSGTIRNCAGGMTPWGSWLACEEDTSKAGTVVKSSVDGKEYTLEKDHGYVFEVFGDVVAKQIPEPIKAWGRAVWEGAAIDPDLTKAYITEDTGRGLFYRWTAPEGAKIASGIARQFGENDGILQAAQLVRNGEALVHYGQLTAADLNKPYPVKWIDGGEDRQAQESNLRDQYPGATQHPKIEGCWPDDKGLWFTLSYTNDKQISQYRDQYGIEMTGDAGMIMFYDFADETMTVKEYWARGEYFDSPDNITVSPWGTIVIAEDGSDPNHLVAFSEKRGSRALAKDVAERGEWAGPVFSKSGNVLFGSIQGDCTYAITGPLGRLLSN